MRARVLAAAAAVVVAGCGAASPIPTTTPSLVVPRFPSAPVVQASASIAAPTPTPARDPEVLRKSASALYTKAADRYNDADRALVKKYATYGTLSRARAAFKASLANERAFVADLKKIQFPPDTVGDVHALIAKIAVIEALDSSGSAAKTWAKVNSVNALLDKAAVPATGAANLVRIDLGLAPAPAG